MLDGQTAPILIAYIWTIKTYLATNNRLPTEIYPTVTLIAGSQLYYYTMNYY
jgi:hypothetical protein